MSRILVCGAQTLYVRGGAELLVETLARQLQLRGHQVDVVSLPFTDMPRSQILWGYLAWRALNMKLMHGKPVDLLIGTKFPSYAARHPNKVVWLTHQHRQAYDLYGTPYSDMHLRPDGRFFAWLVARLDGWGLREASRLYTISKNTAGRLKRFNGFDAEALYPPPKLAPHLHCRSYGDYLLAVGRFEPIKRFDLILKALARTRCGLRCLLAGDGLERGPLERLAETLELGDRVQFLGRVDDETLVELYAECLGVVYPPYDEDYGYGTVEAFLARKPVLSTVDAGGVLEFVEDGVNGYVTQPTPEALADAFERLWQRRHEAPAMGEQGYKQVQEVSWDRVLDTLTATL